jgi:phosphate:Na+ symporter
MTGWLVALVGLKLNVEALALPLVGGGMLLRLTVSGRRGAAGRAGALRTSFSRC